MMKNITDNSNEAEHEINCEGFHYVSVMSVDLSCRLAAVWILHPAFRKHCEVNAM